MTSSIRDEADQVINKVYDEMALVARHGGTDKIALLRQLQRKYKNRLETLLSKEVCIYNITRISHGFRDKSMLING